MTGKLDAFPVDLDISPEERALIHAISITNVPLPLEYYGENLRKLAEMAREYMSKLGNNSREAIEAAASIVVRATEHLLEAERGESAWVVLRASLPHRGFDVPRWHRDGAYFVAAHKVYKLVLALKGQQTRFARIVNREMFEQIEAAQMRSDLLDEESDRLRGKLCLAVEEVFLTEAPLEGVRFLVGDSNAVVHSEPPVHEPRLFASALVGSSSQISEWKNR